MGVNNGHKRTAEASCGYLCENIEKMSPTCVSSCCSNLESRFARSSFVVRISSVRTLKCGLVDTHVFLFVEHSFSALFCPRLSSHFERTHWEWRCHSSMLSQVKTFVILSFFEQQQSRLVSAKFFYKSKYPMKNSRRKLKATSKAECYA